MHPKTFIRNIYKTECFWVSGLAFVMKYRCEYLHFKVNMGEAKKIKMKNVETSKRVDEGEHKGP